MANGHNNMEIPQVNIRPLETDKDPDDDTGIEGGIQVNIWTGEILRKIDGTWTQIYIPT